MVSVGVPEPNRHASRRFESKGIDQLFPQQSHGCRTQDDDTLLMQPDDAFVRAEVQQLREMRICWGRLVIATWLRLHGSAIVRRERRSNVASRTPRATSRMGSPMSARIPRWRIARGKRVHEDLVHRLLGGKTGLRIAGFINDPADSYDGRDDGCDAVAIVDCGAFTASPGRSTNLLRFVCGAPSAAEETTGVAVTTSCGEAETPFARDRRNVSSLARGPSVVSASLHSVRASSCGHSSSHASAVRPVLSRRSCATIASCHAVKRTHSAAASAVPTLEPRIA